MKLIDIKFKVLLIALILLQGCSIHDKTPKGKTPKSKKHLKELKDAPKKKIEQARQVKIN